MFLVFGVVGFAIAYYAFKQAERKNYAAGWNAGYAKGLEDGKGTGKP